MEIEKILRSVSLLEDIQCWRRFDTLKHRYLRPFRKRFQKVGCFCEEFPTFERKDLQTARCQTFFFFFDLIWFDLDF